MPPRTSARARGGGRPDGPADRIGRCRRLDPAPGPSGPRPDEQGLADRRAHPTDGRKTLVEPSAAGRAALEAKRGRRAGWLAQANEDELSGEEREVLARSAALMERLAAR
ncbi:hypothetical protein [Streptomyces sp. ALB3]|uniref:hypothetical protein n=1 Tax=Streptomyces sp. ALB3 TaxID=3374278 RepID=UPI00378880AC